MVSSEASLGWCMQLMFLCKPSKAPVDDRHEQLCEGGGDGYAAVVVHVIRVTFALIQGHYLRVSPCLWSQLLNGRYIKKLSKTINSLRTHVLE